MAEPTEDVVKCLSAARAGSQEALGRLLEAYQTYLLLIARQELAPDLQAKGGASDLVQDTFIEAFRDFPHFQGNTAEELRGWLRRMLLNNLTNFTRRYRGTAKRQTAAEVALGEGPSSANWAEELIADTSTPSEKAIAQEQAQAVQRALERLPADYRQVLLLRYQEGRSFEDIGRLMDRSPNAAEKLWARAVTRLHLELTNVSD
jgi:RNA polymerase sigma-70 factor (ECF subfamily)